MLNVPKVGAPALAAESPDPVEGIAAAIGDLRRLKLTTPIKSHQGMLYEINLREPTAADYIAIGRVPFDVRGIEDNRRAVVDFKLIGQWAACLTGHDEIIIGQMSSRDWLALSARIATTNITTNIAMNDGGQRGTPRRGHRPIDGASRSSTVDRGARRWHAQQTHACMRIA